MKRHLFLSFLLSPLLLSAAVKYSVEFEGLDDAAALRSIKAASELCSLRKRPPESLNILRFRAESDIPEMVQVLHAFGYYDATVNFRIEQVLDVVQVVVTINPGVCYTLEEYNILLYYGSPNCPIDCPEINLKNIGIHLHVPALSTAITESQLRLLELLGTFGYPLASIEKQTMVADYETKHLRVSLEVQTGPCLTFGPLTICGLETIKERFFDYKICWSEGDLYDSRLVESTQKVLLDTGLFSSVMIDHKEVPLENDALPIKIDVTESKHRSVNVGATYQTFFGPGLTFGWEHRNIDGLGRKFTIQGDITKRSHSGIATLSIPHFWIRDQDHVWQAIALYENLTAFNQRSYSIASRLERKFTNCFRAAIGVKGERLFVTDSVDNGNFSLIEAPLYFRWSTANNLLNPTRGTTIEYRATPSANVAQDRTFYLSQELSGSYYLSLSPRDVLVIAQKVTLDSIISDHFSSVPVPKRIFGGSEEDLRGYRYYTVSPLSSSGKPEGGRSAIFYTFEARFRFIPPLGIVPFFDLGNVQKEEFPTFQGKWFKSVGLGLRYFSVIGPIRFDIGFPLDRRKDLDPTYRVFVSIGQTF